MTAGRSEGPEPSEPPEPRTISPVSHRATPEAGGEAEYRHSGVDLGAASRAVELIEDIAAGASRAEVVEGVGGFAGMVRLGEGRLLVAATDGVGTKVEVARLAGKLDTVGIDCVAMSVNDVICTGAEPLMFLDYLAVGRVVPQRVAAIVQGVAEGCRRAGCALLGGETAEHPGILQPDQFDLAGFCVGIVDEEGLLGPDKVVAGDELLGFPSSGVHSNGFSLIRRVLLEQAGIGLDRTYPELGRPLADELLEPTAIYVKPLIALKESGLARSAAHVTGGGMVKNLPRALPDELGAEVDTRSWTPGAVFDLVGRAAGLEPQELFSVLNMGIGMVVVVARDGVDLAIEAARGAGLAPVRVGRVVEEPGVHLL